MINLKNNRLVKNLIKKKKSPKKLTKTDFDELNEKIIKEEKEINEELLKILLTFKGRLHC